MKGPTLKVGEVLDGALGQAVVLAALEEGVKQVGQVDNDALSLGPPQHLEVPVPEPVGAGQLLLLGMHMQDVVIPLWHRQAVSNSLGPSRTVHLPDVLHEGVRWL